MQRQIAIILTGTALAIAFTFLITTTAWAVEAPCDYPLSGQWPEDGDWTCDDDQSPDLPPATPEQWNGNYCVAYGGVSLHGKGAQDEGIITLQNYTPTQDSRIERAYILWSGRARPEKSDDPNIEVLIGDKFEEIDAHLQNEAFSTLDFYWHAYRADITEYYENGQLTSPVTVRGLTIGTAAADDDYDNHGVGIIVVYEDAEHCSYQDIAFFYGNDVLFKGWPWPSGPNSDVACVEVPSLSQATRFDFQMFVGGIADDTRSDAIWFASGRGPKPNQIAPAAMLPATPPDTPIIGLPPGATVEELKDQFQPLTGVEFDSYESSVDCLIPETGTRCVPELRAVASDSEWLCFQIESPSESDRGLGISAAWLSLVVRTARAGISIIPPKTEREIDESHTWTITVESTLGLTATTGITQGLVFTPTIVITPTVAPDATTMEDSCESPQVSADGVTASCTVTISSNSANVYTATATARITQIVGDETLTSDVSTDSATGNSGPAVVTYLPRGSSLAGIKIDMAVNGESATEWPGPLISIQAQGVNVTLSYSVTNSGQEPLTDIAVTDGRGGDMCSNDPELPPEILLPKESFTCQQSEAAQLDVQSRFGLVKAAVQSEPDRAVDDKTTVYYTGVTEDWGDAPDPAPGTGPGNYATTKQDNGPHHRILDGLKLGELIDSEDDGQPTAEALGDDRDDLVYPSDEDSLVSDACLVYGSSVSVTVRATNALTQTNALLYGWFDFDDNGLFSLDERAVADISAGTGSGDHLLTFARALPNNIDELFLRLRLSSDPAAAESIGLALDGEVEDHRLAVGMPTLQADADKDSAFVGETITINAMTATSCGPADQLQVCFDVDQDGVAEECTDTHSDGQASHAYSSDTVREDTVQVWVDVNRNRAKDDSEPDQSVPVTWRPIEDFSISLKPKYENLPVGNTNIVTATLSHATDQSMANGQMLIFTVDGVHAGIEEEVRTDANGRAALEIYGKTPGKDDVSVGLKGADGTIASTAISWIGNYTVTVKLDDQQRIVGTDAGNVNVTVKGIEESEVADLGIFYQVTGINTVGPLTAGKKTDEKGILDFTPYRYDSDANHLNNFDRIVVGITDTISAGFVYTGVTMLEWVPITMSIEPAAEEPSAEGAKNIEVRIGVSETQQILSGVLPLYIDQENLDGQSNRVLSEPYTITVATGQPGSRVIPIEEDVRKIDNLIYEGCDIAFDESSWKLRAWVELKGDTAPTGEEPTCIVEEPTAVGVSGLAAQVEEGGVRLSWHTASEHDILGFNLLRSSVDTDQFVVVNTAPIAAEGTVLGASYVYVDTPPSPGIYRYQLETSLLSGGASHSATSTVIYPTDHVLPNQLFLPAVLRP